MTSSSSSSSSLLHKYVCMYNKYMIDNVFMMGKFISTHSRQVWGFAHEGKVLNKGMKWIDYAKFMCGSTVSVEGNFS